MIQRYVIGEFEGLDKDEYGDYVKYEDHKRIVDDAVKQLDTLSQEVYRLKKELQDAQSRAVAAFARDYGRSKY